MRARIATLSETGGPDVIRWVDRDLPAPGAGEVQIRQTAVGLNYIDVYHRDGTYRVDLSQGLGAEAAGVVAAVGDGVDRLEVGMRVGTFGPTRGAYATARNVKADEVVTLPDSIDDRTAAAIMLKGCTAAYLVGDCGRVEAGQSVLVMAAAGGVGHLLVGWLKDIGAIVIGVVGSADKAERTTAAGADHLIRHDCEDIAERVKAITDGAGVPLVLDGVGGATWAASLDSAARRGLIVSYGNAGGQVKDVNLAILSQKGSLFVTRPTLFDYAATRTEKQGLVDRLFAMVEKGAVVPEIGQTFALEDAADAHRALEAGETHGSTVLLPKEPGPRPQV